VESGDSQIGCFSRRFDGREQDRGGYIDTLARNFLTHYKERKDEPEKTVQQKQKGM
jgi:hypothetical protein